MRIIGLDPGLCNTGWGVIDVRGSNLKHVANGTVKTNSNDPAHRRLKHIFDSLITIISEHKPDEAAVEETFMNNNPRSAIKLGEARGIALLTPAHLNIPVFEYAANKIKKAVVGVGHADKVQIQAMMNILFPGCPLASPDSADALAIAVCHANHRETNNVWLAREK